MENINDRNITKYQVTIHFDMNDEFMSYVPAHRLYINGLIEKNVIDYYTVSLETQRAWIVINAADKNEVEACLSKSPLYKFWTLEVDELFMYDGLSYRLPALQLN